jgi:microcystin-dependent protein
LFAVVSTTYGVGDGTTTFNLPDLRGRGIAGADNMGGTGSGRLSLANTLGTTGGSETVTLTAAQSGVPAHQHANTVTNNAVTTGAGSAHTHTQNAHGHTIVNQSTGTQIAYMGNGASGYTDQWGQAGQAGLSAGTPIQLTTATNQNESAHTHSVTSNVTISNANESAHTHSVTSNVSISNVNNSAAPAAESHSVLQPTMVLNYIIKAL